MDAWIAQGRRARLGRPTARGYPYVRLFALPLLAILFSPIAATATEPVDLELVFAADGSGSIDETEFKLQREGYAQAITSSEVLGAIRAGPHQAIAIALMEWGAPQSQEIVVDWMVIRDLPSAEAFAQKLLAQPRKAWGYNSISAAIDFSANMIRTNAYEGRSKIIDVSGDGPNIGGRAVQAARDDAALAGITINALVIRSPGGGNRGPGGVPLEDHYERDVIGGRGRFVTIAETRKNFAEAILKKMIKEIADSAASATQEANLQR